MYSLPEKIKGQCDEETYNSWLYRRAASLLKRDRKHHVVATLKEYRDEIHQAVLTAADTDAYTGERMNWGLIGTYNDGDARTGGKAYRRRFAEMPSIDHDYDRAGSFQFRICSWRTNDCKSDLSVEELIIFCRKILQFQENHI